MEAIPTFYTIRNTMEDPSQLKKAVIYTMTAVWLTFLIFQLSFYTTYSNDNIATNVLHMYNFNTHKFLFILEYVFNFILILWLPILMISMIEQLEHFNIIKQLLSAIDEKGGTDWKKVVLVRSSGCAFIMAMTMITDDLIRVTNLCGNLFNGAILLTPIVLVYTKCYVLDRRTRQRRVIVHDLVLFGVAFVLLSYGTYLAIIGH